MERLLFEAIRSALTHVGVLALLVPVFAEPFDHGEFTVTFVAIALVNFYFKWLSH